MRHYRGDEAGAFYHKDFQRDRMDLVEKMTCHKTDAAPKVAVPKTHTTTNTERVPPAAPKPVVQAPRIVPRPPVVPQQQQQQLSLSSQQEIVAQLQKQQQHLKAPEILPANSQLDAAARLHDAIEQEVNRRLKERLQAAAVSRNAISAMMMHRQPVPAQRDLRALHWNSAGFRGLSLQTQLLQMQQAKQQGNLDPNMFQLTAWPRMASDGLDELPSTNIQGAKTA
jgi:hypothetical protein